MQNPRANTSLKPGGCDVNIAKTLAALGLEEHQITLIFLRIISFMLFTVLLSLMYFFEEFLIHDSRGFMILKNN